MAKRAEFLGKGIVITGLREKEKKYRKYAKLYEKDKTNFKAYFIAMQNRRSYMNQGGKKKLKSLGQFVIEADNTKARSYKKRGGKMVTIIPKKKKSKTVKRKSKK